MFTSTLNPPPSFQGGGSEKVHGENRPRGGAEGPAQGEGQIQEAQGETPPTRHVGFGVGTLPALRSSVRAQRSHHLVDEDPATAAEDTRHFCWPVEPFESWQVVYLFVRLTAAASALVVGGKKLSLTTHADSNVTFSQKLARTHSFFYFCADLL